MKKLFDLNPDDLICPFFLLNLYFRHFVHDTKTLTTSMAPRSALQALDEEIKGPTPDRENLGSEFFAIDSGLGVLGVVSRSQFRISGTHSTDN